MFTTPLFWVTVIGGALFQRVLPVRARGWFIALLSIAYLWTMLGGLDGLGSQQASLAVFLVLGVVSFRLAPLAVRSSRARYFLILGMLAYLALHKYLPPILGSFGDGSPGIATFAVPVGISYFTFKLIHFLIDLGRRRKHEGRLGEFLAYLFVFPAFTAGPIERWDHYREHRRPAADGAQWVGGLTRIAVGLIKKFAIVEVLLRGRVLEIDPGALAANPEAGAAAAWSYLILWYMYVYLDFSAYTDLAIGCSRLFGIELMENFNWPIFAANIGDFWKRWHMTLANWCQSYVYLPMIGWTRNPYLAVFATFLAIGVWHGASLNWVLWGLYHGAGVAVYLTWSRWRRHRGVRPASSASIRLAARGAATIVTFLFVAAGFAFSATHVDGQVLDRVPVALTLLGKCFALG